MNDRPRVFTVEVHRDGGAVVEDDRTLRRAWVADVTSVGRWIAERAGFRPGALPPDEPSRPRSTQARAMASYRRALVTLGRYRWFAWLTWTLVVPVDRWLYHRSHGRLSVMHAGLDSRPALPTLLLTTNGRLSGRSCTTPVLYVEDGDGLVVVASNFGRASHPAWSANLLANPHATIQIRDRTWQVIARQLGETEAAALWPRLVEVYSPWKAYHRRTDRSFRIFRLERRPCRERAGIEAPAQGCSRSEGDCRVRRHGS